MSRLVPPVFTPSLALAALVACTATNPGPLPPPGPYGHLNGPRAPVHAELRLCAGASAFNVGPVAHDRSLAAYTPYRQSPAGPLLRNPTDGACVSSGFGPRLTASGGGRDHSGIDLANELGGFVYAAGPGRVTAAGWRGTYGLMVEIDHGRGVRTRYAHLNELNPALRPGAAVAGGVPLGRMGSTGNATGVHLHYEVWAGGAPINPLG